MLYCRYGIESKVISYNISILHTQVLLICAQLAVMYISNNEYHQKIVKQSFNLIRSEFVGLRET